MYENVDYIS